MHISFLSCSSQATGWPSLFSSTFNHLMLHLRLIWDQCKVTAEGHSDYSLSCRSLAQGHGFCVIVNKVSEMSDRRQSRSNMWASTGAALGSWYIWLDHFSSLPWQIWPWSTSARVEKHFKSTFSEIPSQYLIHPLEGSLQIGLKRQSDALMAFGCPRSSMWRCMGNVKSWLFTWKCM